MRSLWHRNALIYQLDPWLFRDADGDGCGDLRGVTESLDHVRLLGANAIWLTPFHPTPYRDGGYDVSDYLGVDPRLGDLADFVSLAERAEELGMHVIVDLVAHHTSDRHPWFQAARRDRGSPFRDYYLWADRPPEHDEAPIFPGAESSVWSWDDAAGQYYRHLFYSHEPDLNLANPRVREEIYRVIAFWRRLGVSGFRIDAASHMVDAVRRGDGNDGLWLLEELRDLVSRRDPGAILMGEADVPPERYGEYFGDGDRLTHLLDFWINNRLFLALAREDASALAQALAGRNGMPDGFAHVVWLRNHDELDLERLSEEERNEVLARFAPDESMRVYGRGIRRRLAPMLGGDARRLAMAQALLLSLPGLPVIRCGEEIGMGDDLSRPEREAVRTPMQWSDGPNAGFSEAPAERLIAPVIADGEYGYRRVNVRSQLADGDSLLSKLRRMAQTRLGLHEMGGRCRPVDSGCRPVLALRYENEDGTAGARLLALVNLSGSDAVAEPRVDGLHDAIDVLVDGDAYAPAEAANGRLRVPLRGYGYRWLRVR